MSTMKATGTLIHRFPLTETSLIVHWCTREHGIVRTVVKGARRPRSPFAGKIDLFYNCDLEIHVARQGELHLLKELSVIERRMGLRRSYLQTVAASFFVKWIEIVAETDTPIPELADLLERGLAFLDTKEVTRRAVEHYENQLAQLTGVAEAGAVAYQSLAHHYHRVPAQRAELVERLGIGK